jgi:hypothetical protein
VSGCDYAFYSVSFIPFSFVWRTYVSCQCVCDGLRIVYSMIVYIKFKISTNYNILLGQENRPGEDYAVGEDRAGRSPFEGRRHLRHPRGPRVERVGSVTPGDHKGEGKKGGLRLRKSNTPLVLRDVTSFLRLVGCSLRVRGASPAKRGAYPPGMLTKSVEKKGASSTVSFRLLGYCYKE